jgi:hypothetical protein
MKVLLIIISILTLAACDRKLNQKDIEVANCICKKKGKGTAINVYPVGQLYFKDMFNNGPGIRIFCSNPIGNENYVHYDDTYTQECDERVNK